MRISALLRLLDIPFGGVDLFLDRQSVNVIELYVVAANADDVVVLKQRIFLRVFQKCGDIACNEILVVAYSGNKRSVLSRCVNPVGEVLEHYPQCIAALKFLYRFGDGTQRVAL